METEQRRHNFGQLQISGLMLLSIICGVVQADEPDVVAHWNFGTEENTRLEHRTVASLGIDPGEYLFDGDRPLPITDNGQPIAKLFGTSCLEPTNLKQPPAS